ncbi:MAG: hypothetical protein KA472_11465 [Pseudomonadales bacterium]|nr:hypothetical protein [Pseudomonadales bacterium]
MLQRVPGRWRPGSGGGGSVTTTYPLTGTTSIKSVAPPHCGKLARSSSTALTFTPFNGDLIRIQGTLYQIPSAGITGLANTSVFVNGSGGSSLSSSTLYYVYAFINSGTVTADFSTTAHATSSTAGNIGTQVKSGDETRTLVGMIRTNGSSQFVDTNAQRFVRSWFNEDGVSTTNSFTASRNTTSTSFVEANSEIRNEALLWSGEKWHIAVGGGGYNSAAGNAVWIGFGVDSTSTAESGAPYFNGAGANYASTLGGSIVKTGLSEGYHYCTLLLAVSAGTGTLGGAAPFSGTITTLCARTMK